jgi:OmpA-OmpF porin, OOP family
MRPTSRGARAVGLAISALVGFAALPAVAQTQPAGTADEWVTKLAGLETAPDLDVAALRQQAMERVKSRADSAPIKRPPLAPQLVKLPQVVADIQFDEDAAVIRPDSYRTLGRIADTLTHPSLLGYKFLIVGHTPSSGRRENNLTLSQRRADVVREVLINTFKVSPKRLQSVGLGEEQLLDSGRPASPANQRVQVVTVGENDLGTIASRPSPTATAPRPPATTRHRR